MQEWLCGLTAALIGITVGLAVKLFLMKKSLREIRQGLDERLNQETNTLLDTASRDRDLLALREALNDQLRKLREQRQRYQQGDQQLKQSLTQITHDLRTPLTAICGYLQLAEAEPASPRLKQILAILSERAQTLKQLSEQLFHYSVAVCDPPKAVRQLIDLRAALEKNLAAVVGFFEKQGLCPQVTMPDVPVWRTLDPKALDRILQNLLDNAVKYGGSELTVKLDAEGRMEWINSAGSLRPVDVEKLFDRYYTVNTGRQATGLGLTIAKGLAEQQGGTLQGELRGGHLILTLSFPPERGELG